MDDNLIKHSQDLMKNLESLIPNLQGFAKIVDDMAKKSIEDLRATNPELAEAKAKEYAEAMKDANAPEVFAELKKNFGML